MTRLPEVNRDAVAEGLRGAFDALIADSGGEVPLGPGAVAALSPEMALRRTNRKFVRRFAYVQEQMAKAGIEMTQQQLEQMESFWQDSKKLVG